MVQPPDTAATAPLLSAADVRRLAAELDLRPTKQWGQNFVIDPNTIRRIVAAADLAPDEHVLEIGPGLGSLTLGLLDAAALRLIGAGRGQRARVGEALALQADCLTGVWAAAASKRLGPVPAGFWGQLVWSWRNVVEDLDPQDLGGPHKPLRDLTVLRAGLRLAAGVIVRQDHARRTRPDGRLEDLPGMDEGLREGAYADQRRAQDLVFGVQEHDDEVLPVEIGYASPQ